MARTREFDKEQVLDRAWGVFAAQGYEATSVRDLITAMDISTSSMYEVFGDKRGIYLAVLERSCEMEQAYTQQRAQQAESPRAFIESMFDAVGEVASAGMKGSLALGAMVEFGTRDPGVTQRLLDHYFKVAEIVAGVLAKAQEAGTLRTEVPAAHLAHTMITTMYGVATVTGIKPDFAYRDAVKTVMLNLLNE